MYSTLCSLYQNYTFSLFQSAEDECDLPDIHSNFKQNILLYSFDPISCIFTSHYVGSYAISFTFNLCYVTCFDYVQLFDMQAEQCASSFFMAGLLILPWGSHIVPHPFSSDMSKLDAWVIVTIINSSLLPHCSPPGYVLLSIPTEPQAIRCKTNNY